MESTAFEQGKWFDDRTMIIRTAAADVSTCRSKGPDGVEGERMYDYVVACQGLRSKIRRVEGIEDCDTRLSKNTCEV